MDNIKLILKSSGDWRKIKKADALIKIFDAEGGFLVPEKFDKNEPVRITFQPEEYHAVHEFWKSKSPCVLFKRRKPYLSWLDITISHGKRFNEVLSGFDIRYFKEENNISKLVSFAKKLYEWGSIDHGYICHVGDWKIKNKFVKPTLINGKPMMSGGNWLNESLPGIYWLNFFGPTYVDFFGNDKFASLPAYHKEKLYDGGFMILTSKSPFAYHEVAVQKSEKVIISHLGSGAFFDKSNPTKKCCVPKLIEKNANKLSEIMAIDPIAEVVADVNDFIEEVPKLADTLLGQFENIKAYSPDSLDLLDNIIMKRSYRNIEPWKKEKEKNLLRQIIAYYGEVLRINLRGSWGVKKGTTGDLHPVIEFGGKSNPKTEYLFPRIIKFWLSRERTDSLSIKFFTREY